MLSRIYLFKPSFTWYKVLIQLQIFHNLYNCLPIELFNIEIIRLSDYSGFANPVTITHWISSNILSCDLLKTNGTCSLSLYYEPSRTSQDPQSIPVWFSSWSLLPSPTHFSCWRDTTCTGPPPSNRFSYARLLQGLWYSSPPAATQEVEVLSYQRSNYYNVPVPVWFLFFFLSTSAVLDAQ